MQVGDGGGNRVVAPRADAPVGGQAQVATKGGWASLVDRVKGAVSSIQQRILGKEGSVERTLDQAADRQRQGNSFLNGKPRPGDVTPPAAAPLANAQGHQAVHLGLAPLDGAAVVEDIKGPVSKGGQGPTLPTPQAKGTFWT